MCKKFYAKFFNFNLFRTQNGNSLYVSAITFVTNKNTASLEVEKQFIYLLGFHVHPVMVTKHANENTSLKVDG